MNRIAGILVIFFMASAANAGMVRFVRAADGQTIVVDRNGTQVAVTLTGVSVQPEDQASARAFLEHELAGRWLLVENGNVWRSPDTFFVNGAMQQRGFLRAGRAREIVLGEVDLGVPKSDPRPEPKKSPRTSRRSPAPRRRG